MVDVTMLPGIFIKQLKRFPDERGSFTEILRSDWKDLVGEDVTVQANLSVSYPGIVRAWHKHERGQVDYFVVIKGAMKICAFDDDTEELDEIISSGEDLQVVRIPGQFWHGTKVVGNETAYVVYMVNRLYDYRNPDERRRSWDDPKLIPRLVNGKPDDPRAGKPWDWFLSPNK